MLRRAGFGVTGPEVDAALTRDWPTYVDAMLAANPDADPGAVATPMPTFASPPAPGKGATPAARKEFGRQLAEQESVLSGWWLRRMVAVSQPLHEKLTLLWHNHFATSAQKVRAASHMAAQNQKLRTGSLGDFRSLAYSMLTDAAMLRWLDGQANTAKAPNENLAREFMELFALGHGNGYTEDDVRAGARALTGWVIGADDHDLDAPQTPRRQRPRRCSASPAISTPPASATPCWLNPSRRNMSPDGCGSNWLPTSRRRRQALDRLVSAYGPGRDLRALTRAILTDDEFTGARAAKINTPVEWLVGVLRSLRVPVDQPAQLKMAEANVAGTGATAVLPAQRRWLAARPGVAVHRERRSPVARREPDGPHRRLVRHRGHCPRRPHRRRRLSDRHRSLVGPNRQRAATPGAQTAAAGRGRRQHTRIPDVMMPRSTAADS